MLGPSRACLAAEDSFAAPRLIRPTIQSTACGRVAQPQFQMVCERPPAAFGGSPPRQEETRAKRARGSLTHHLELQSGNLPLRQVTHADFTYQLFCLARASSSESRLQSFASVRGLGRNMFTDAFISRQSGRSLSVIAV